MTPLSPLTACLAVAVPLHIEIVRKWAPEARIAWCHAHADVVASKSDDLLFGTKKKGEAAQLFNQLARTLACLAFQPGGVRDFQGLSWVAT